MCLSHDMSKLLAGEIDVDGGCLTCEAEFIAEHESSNGRQVDEGE